MSIFSSKKNKKEDERKRCDKYKKWGDKGKAINGYKKKWCPTYFFKDDTWNSNYCQKHGCKICFGMNKKDTRQGIGNEFFVCDKQSCREITKNNSTAIGKLITGNNNIKLIFSSEFLTASDLFLKDLVTELEEVEKEAIFNNTDNKPVISSVFLKIIRSGIESKSKILLNTDEKEILNNSYNRAGGDVENTINEKSEAFTKILKERKNKRERRETEIQIFIEVLKGLEGWDLLSDTKKNDFISEVKKHAGFHFKVILNSVKETIKPLLAKKKKEDDDIRERERERDENPTNLPPQQEPKDNSDQPGPTPTPQSPSPSDKSPSPDNSLAELEQAKNKVKTEHNLSEEEFNFIIVPLTDKDLLEHVSWLIGKVKESQEEVKSLDKVYSLLEFLLSYREAAADSLKRKAYEAVNSYHNQVDLAIQKLESQKNLAGDYLKKLVASQNQKELNIIYNEIKKSPEFSQTDTQKIIDNHQKRVQVAVNLETNSTITEIERQLATQLRTIVNGDTDKNTLESLHKELRGYNNSPEKIYSQHREIIETTLAEISSELARREQSTQEQNKAPIQVNNQSKTPVKPNKGSTNPAVIVVGGILLLTLITFLGYQVFSLRKKRLKKRLKTQKPVK